MSRRIGLAITAGLVVMAALLAGCGNKPATEPPAATSAQVGPNTNPSVPSSPPAALSQSYKTLLELTTEKGWEITDEQKLAGGASLTQSTVRGCTIGLTLDTSGASPTFTITSLEGEPLEFYGEEAVKALGKPGISRTDFDAALHRLQAQGKIALCE